MPAFKQHLLLKERLSERVTKDYVLTVQRLLAQCQGNVTPQAVANYLAGYLNKTPKTYNNQLDGLRALLGRYCGREDLVAGYKRAYVPASSSEELSDKQVRAGFYGLTSDEERGLYLLLATAGLRKREALDLRRSDVTPELRCIRAEHDTRTKKAGVTFYNPECERYLALILANAEADARLFRLSDSAFRKLWDKASARAGTRITAQQLRIWHSSKLGELMVPDRYVDIFQGRAPRSVLAKHYTGKALLRLKHIYDHAELKVLDG